MRMLKYDIDRNSLTKFYISYIRPILEYGSIIWDNLNKNEADLLESIQLDAARIIAGLRRGTSHAILYKELGWIPLSERRSNQKLIQFFKILNQDTPAYINTIVDNYNTHNIGYSLRNRNLRHPKPIARTTYFQKSFFLSTIDLWNNLDPELNNCTSLHSFKETIKRKTPAPPKHYSFGNRKENIIICQLRNNKSQLKANLFADHLADSAVCPYCDNNETVDHFFLECPKHLHCRIMLINSLISQPNIYSSISITSNNLLAGNQILYHENNCLIMKYVMEYIYKTKR